MRRMYRSQVVLVGRLWFLLSVSLLFNLLVLVRVRWPSRGNNNTNNIDNNDDEGVVDELTASKSRFPSTSITSTDGIGFGIGAEEGEREQLPSDFYRLLNLTEQQCKTAFPDLTRDIDANVKLGPFKLKKAHATGPLQAGIRDGKLYIIRSESKEVLTPELLQARTAALHQIHRAILTAPEALPDTIFSLNIRDQAYGTAWSYARPAFKSSSSTSSSSSLASRAENRAGIRGVRGSAATMPPITRAFLMPHFSFWNWPLPSVGSLSRAAEAISAIENEVSFAEKDPRVVWRGTVGFNGVYFPSLRKDLVEATKGEKWADVRALDRYEIDGDGDTQKGKRGFDNEGEGEVEVKAVTEAVLGLREKGKTKRKRKGYRGRRKGEEMAKYKSEDIHTKGEEEAGDKQETQTGERDTEPRDEDDDDGDNNKINDNDIPNTRSDETTSALMVEDFCRYKYVLYTDGITYSGRLPFLQLCRSVLISPPIAWHQYTTHLIKPLFSWELDLLSSSSSSSSSPSNTNTHSNPFSQSRNSRSSPLSLPIPPPNPNLIPPPSLRNRHRQREHKWTPSESIRRAWPTNYGPEEANAVFVAPDWSDLRETIEWLEANPDVAEGIADRQRRLFAGTGTGTGAGSKKKEMGREGAEIEKKEGIERGGGGYLSPAAETCYWRALIRGWSSVVRVDGDEWEGREEERGVSWEEFSMGL